MSQEVADQCTQLKDNYRFFRYLDKEETAVVTGYLQCQFVSAGQVLWNEGDPSDRAAFVVDGRVEIKKQTEFVGKHVIVGIYGQGSIVGELCLLSGEPRAVTATALIDTSLLMLSRKQFDLLLEEHPDLGAKLLKGMFLALSTRLRKSFERLASVF
ncbi:MAG TPA: cyclic nucleotide-binding domain-containing protein [Geopsychrobacteraceae bacterium]|nr:cyclic nucleotide-binding domain-containing protein [Geopsychrobacteraceae bacterium]